MRWEVIAKFNQYISPYLSEIKSIAIVGGNLNEPELDIFRNSKDLVIHVFGIDSNVGTQDFTFLDLNTKFEGENFEYDLIICSQVLKHIWDVKQGIQNIVQLSKKGSLIWIGCPSSNYAHGSPDYFSAGYQPALISNLMEIEKVREITSGTLGSKRYYFLTHVLQIWASRAEHKSPLTHGFSRYFLNQSIGRLFSYFKSAEVLETPRYYTETFWFGHKL